MLEVPGSYEVVFGAQSLLRKGKLEGKPYDAVVCVGCLIKGHTMHFEYICEAVTQVSAVVRAVAGEGDERRRRRHSGPAVNTVVFPRILVALLLGWE